MKIVHNEIKTSIPQNWSDRTMLTFVAPFRAGEFATNVVVTKHAVEARQSLEDFVHEQNLLLAESLETFEVLDYRVNQLNGNSCCQQLHRFQAENGVVQQVQTFVLAKGHIYVITGTAAVEKFNEGLEAFRQIVEDFVIEEDD